MQEEVCRGSGWKRVTADHTCFTRKGSSVTPLGVRLRAGLSPGGNPLPLRFRGLVLPTPASPSASAAAAAAAAIALPNSASMRKNSEDATLMTACKTSDASTAAAAAAAAAAAVSFLISCKTRRKIMAINSNQDQSRPTQPTKTNQDQSRPIKTNQDQSRPSTGSTGGIGSTGSTANSLSGTMASAENPQRQVRRESAETSRLHKSTAGTPKQRANTP